MTFRIHFVFSIVDCSKYNKPSNNSYCDRMIESLLVLITGFPDQPQETLTTTATTTVIQTTATTGDSFITPSDFPALNDPAVDPTVFRICCFLTSFQNARESCCNQIATFCGGVVDQSLCPSTTIPDSPHSKPDTPRGGSGYGPNPDDSTDGDNNGSDHFTFAKMIQNGYSFIKRVGHEIFENFMNNKKK